MPASEITWVHTAQLLYFDSYFGFLPPLCLLQHASSLHMERECCHHYMDCVIMQILSRSQCGEVQPKKLRLLNKGRILQWDALTYRCCSPDVRNVWNGSQQLSHHHDLIRFSILLLCFVFLWMQKRSFPNRSRVISQSSIHPKNVISICEHICAFETMHAKLVLRLHWITGY